MNYRETRERYEKRLAIEQEQVKRTKKMIRKLKNLEELEQQNLPLPKDED